MAKKRRTLKQKMHSDTRNQTVSNSQSVSTSSKGVPTFSLPQDKQPTSEMSVLRPVQKNAFTIATDYHYLSADLRKTVVLTVSVILVELVIHYFMH